MNTKTLIIAGGVVAAGVVLYGLRKKISALVATQQADAAAAAAAAAQAAAAKAQAAKDAASNMPFGGLQPVGRSPFAGFNRPRFYRPQLPHFLGADAPPLDKTVQTTQSVATLVNTSVTTLAGIAGLALTAMTLMEKKKSLAKV
jgi:hypothetical protein